METVQQNGRITLFSSKFHYNIYSILFGFISAHNINQSTFGIDQMELYGVDPWFNVHWTKLNHYFLFHSLMVPTVL